MFERGGRRRLVMVLGLVAGGLLLLGGWKAWAAVRDRMAIAAVEEEIANGRTATAARALHGLLARRPDWDEALELLGACELARGRIPQAEAAWSRVRPDSPSALRAAQGRMKIEIDRGRFAEAERIILDAAERSGTDASRVAALLGPLYGVQGRVAESLRLTEAYWEALDREGKGASVLTIKLLRSHIDLQQSPMAPDDVRSLLDRAASRDPQDDRVWLGKANLAIRTGSYEAAKRWLDACLRRRPEDVPVWRARLDWAVRTNDLAAGLEALHHLPAAESSPAEVARLAAWLAARRGDRGAERQALERLIAVDPADLAGLDRLVELATQEGQPARAAELRGRKEEIRRLAARYQKLHRRNQPLRDAEELARLAEQLGQHFQARVLLTLACAFYPDRDDLQRELTGLRRSEPAREEPSGSLADLLAIKHDS